LNAYLKNGSKDMPTMMSLTEAMEETGRRMAKIRSDMASYRLA
jgi:hypothetical protein